MNCKSDISFNDFLYFLNDFFTRCKFWPTWFWCSFDGLYTRFKFIFPVPNCVIRHTRGSLSSRKFSHQLHQRTIKFWASFNVSPFFIFLVGASTNHFYYSGQWLRVFIWQIVCLTFSLTCTFIHRCVDLEYTLIGIYWFLSCPTWISRYKTISNSFRTSLVGKNLK